jgi:hypothetical protein
MNNKKQLTVIGATGNLGAPVVKILLEKGFFIKAIVRNPEKARILFGNHENIQIVKADLNHPKELKEALKDTEYLYLNLSTHTTELQVPFAAEREGIANILKSIDREKIKQIISISGLGALDNVPKKNGFRFIPNIIRKQGHKMIKESGIPYTILHCSWFFDSFVLYQRNGAYPVIGNNNSHIFFTNCIDFTNHLVNAIGNRAALYKEFPVQGKTGYKHSDAAKLFFSAFAPSVKVNVLPMFILNILSRFKKEMRFVKHMADYSFQSYETYLAEEFQTIRILGDSETSPEEYAAYLKKMNLYQL